MTVLSTVLLTVEYTVLLNDWLYSDSLHEATSLATDVPGTDIVDTARTRPSASIAEDLPTEYTARSLPVASVVEDVTSEQSASRRTKSISTAVDKTAESAKYSSAHSAAEESSIAEEISDAK